MFLDIGLGIITAIFLKWFFIMEWNPAFIIAGILITVLPDADFLFYFLKRGRDKDRIDDYLHRDYIHYPLIYLPLGTLVFYYFGGREWAVLFFVCLFLHFLHDSIAVGWGVKWLYPLTNNNYAFLYLYSRKEKKGLRRLIFSFDEKTQVGYVRKHGDSDWIKNIYYKWHPIAIVEFSFFVVAIILLIIFYGR